MYAYTYTHTHIHTSRVYIHEHTCMHTYIPTYAFIYVSHAHAYLLPPHTNRFILIRLNSKVPVHLKPVGDKAVRVEAKLFIYVLPMPFGSSLAMTDMLGGCLRSCKVQSLGVM